MKAVHPSHLTTHHLHYHWYFHNQLGSDQFTGVERARASLTQAWRCHLAAYEHHHILLEQHHNSVTQTLPMSKALQAERVVCTSFIRLVKCLHQHMKVQARAQHTAAGWLCHSAFALMLQNHKSLVCFRTVGYRGSKLSNINSDFPGQPQQYLHMCSSSEEDCAFEAHLLTTAAVLWVASWRSLRAQKWAGHFQPMGSLRGTAAQSFLGGMRWVVLEPSLACHSQKDSGTSPERKERTRKERGSPTLLFYLGTLPGCYHSCFSDLFPTGVHSPSEGSWKAWVTKATCPFCVISRMACSSSCTIK